MEISKCLKSNRIKQNMTQEYLAESLGVSRQTISSWETGKSYPDIISVIKISDLFHISLDQLLKEDDKLIHNMKQEMDVVYSNRSVLFTIIFAIIVFGGFYLVRTFIHIPKIDHLGINLTVMGLFIMGVIIYMIQHLNASNFLNKQTSNKTIVKTILVAFEVVSLFGLFPLIEIVVKENWQITLIRGFIIFLIILINGLLFHFIDKYK